MPPDLRPRVPRSEVTDGIGRYLLTVGCTCETIEIIGDTDPRYGDHGGHISVGHDENCPALDLHEPVALVFAPADPNLS